MCAANPDGKVIVKMSVCAAIPDGKVIVRMSVCAAIPDGKVIGMFAFAKKGLQGRSFKKYDFDTLDDVIINDLGGKLISAVSKSDSYSLLTIKGED